MISIPLKAACPQSISRSFSFSSEPKSLCPPTTREIQ